MALEGDSSGILLYKPASKGVNLRVMRQDLQPTEALKTSNLIWKDGMEKRPGYLEVDDATVSGSNPITGVHRFYFGIQSRQLLASSGEEVRYLATGTWTLIKDGLEDGAQVRFETWGAKDTVFMGNGDDSPFQWDGSSESSVTNLTVKVTQFLSYQDRLLFIASDKPGELGWSNSLDETTWNFATGTGEGTSPEGATGVVPDTFLYGMIIHAARVADAGIKAKVLLAGANGMYIFSGTSLIAPSTNAASDYSIESLATKIGCISPLTMQWTPKGTIYLGADKQVYILPFDSITPIPIGHKIQSSGNGRVDGLEVIPSNQMPSVSAVYHEGYYKLSIPITNGTFNSVQWWLDIDRMEIDENRYFGPWYGPMIGMRFRAQTVQSGPGDDNEWIGGEADGVVGGFVYNAGISGSFTDQGEEYEHDYQTFYNPLSNPALMKAVSKLEIELRSGAAVINVIFLDTTAQVSSPISVSITQDAILWNQQNWNTFNWASLLSKRIQISPTNDIKCRYLSVGVKGTSSTAYKFYALGAKFTEESVPFGAI